VHFLIVIMASSIARGHVRTTAVMESRNMAAKHQIDKTCSLAWFTMYLFDTEYPCYAQLTPINSRYLLTSIMWP